MAAPPRQMIREALRDILLGKTTAQDRVFPTRDVPWKKTELPGIAIYTHGDERDEGTSTLAGDLYRVARVEILGVVSAEGATNVDDAADALADEVERVVPEDPTLGGLVVGTEYVDTALGVDDAQGRPVGAAAIQFHVRFKTPAPA